MSDYYPIFLNLQGKRCLVVGGGEVATRKVEGLLDAGALVTVVSPALTDALSRLVRDDALWYEARTFREDDVQGCALVIGATDQPAVNQTVYEASQRYRVWVNIVDVPQSCDFIAPALVRRGALQIAISTSGHSPTLAKRIRQQLEEQYGPEYAELLDWLGQERARIRQEVDDPVARTASYERLVDLVWSGALPVSMLP